MRKFLIIFLFLCFSFSIFHFSFASDHVLISQFQVSGASSTDEFIELYNPTDKNIDLFDYKIQKKTNSGTVYNIVSSFPEKSIIKPFSYFLLAHNNFSKSNFVKPDLIYSSFSVANDNSIILFDPDSNIVDVVGFGNCLAFEVSCLSNILSNQSYIRVNDYNNYGYGYGYGYGFNNIIDCSSFDSDNNKNDFTLLLHSSPRNSNFINQCRYTSLLPVIDNKDNQKDILSDNLTPINDQKSNVDETYKSLFPFQNGDADVINFSEDVVKNINELSNSSNVFSDQIIKDVIKNPPKSSVVLNSYANNVLDVEDVRSMNIGDSVSFYGIVASLSNIFLKNSFYINGIQVYNSKSDFPELKIGDKVYISGILSSNYGEKRVKIKNKNDIKIISRNNKIDFIDMFNEEEDYSNVSSKLVYVSGEVSRRSTNKIYILNNDIETEVYVYKNTGIDYKSIKLGDNIGVYGILNLKNDEYRILPRNKDDIVFIDKIQEGTIEKVEAASVGVVEESIVEEEKLKTKYEKSKIDEDNKTPIISSYKIENKNNNLKNIKYFIIGIIFFIVFIFVIFFYRLGFFMKIILFFQIILDKIKNKC